MTPQRRRDGLPAVRLDVDAGPDDGVVVVRAAGRLCAATYPAVQRDLAALLGRADCVLVDAERLGFANLAALSVFARALEQAGGWPAARLGVFTPDRIVRAALHSSRTARLIAVAESAELALARCEQRPAEVRATWDESPSIEMPARIRHEAADRFRCWGLAEDVILDALVVVNELAANVVDHARTRLGLRATFDGSLLTILARDHSPAAPLLRAPDPRARRGRGMQMVDALAVRWGWRPHGNGKTVWAQLAPGG